MKSGKREECDMAKVTMLLSSYLVLELTLETPQNPELNYIRNVHSLGGR